MAVTIETYHKPDTVVTIETNHKPGMVVTIVTKPLKLIKNPIWL